MQELGANLEGNREPGTLEGLDLSQGSTPKWGARAIFRGRLPLFTPFPPAISNMAIRCALRCLPFIALFASGPSAADDGSRPQTRSYPMDAVMQPIIGDRDFAKANFAIQVVSTRTGDEVWAWDGDEVLAPASVTKVVTSAAALKRLGATWRFHTYVMTDGEIDKDGVLDGNIYLKGGGDPTFVIEKAWKLVRDIKLLGITEVKGDIFFDDAYFDRDYFIRGWDKPTDRAAGPSYYAPIGAFNFNFNTADIVVSPGLEAGEPARVYFETDAPRHLVLVSEALTVPKGKRAWLEVEREVDPKTYTVTFTIKGDVPLETETEHHYRAVSDPLAFSISALETLIRNERLKFGRIKVGPTPKDAEVLLDYPSQPLHEILNHTNKYSSNLMAEAVLKALGAESRGLPGTTEKGVSAVSAYLASIGIPTGSYTLVNGSGLTREGKLAPSQINAVLLDMYMDPKLGPEFAASLAVAGVDGTLRSRYDDSQAGYVRGKTGSLNSVNCVAGYARGADGETYVFTILANDVENNRAVRSIQDQVAQVIMAWNPSTHR
jgi:D-alanyl-D-alanine carboxypeptidase/D-alanyl-D-alanine-endopeptidase (penicillin-binding protein 4)